MLGLLATVPKIRAATATDAGWRELAESEPKASQRSFAAALAQSGGHDRGAALGLALSLLNTAPLTDSRLRDAAGRLQTLAAGDDEIARAARYWLGRVDQLFRTPADYAGAAGAYEALVQGGTRDHWGGEALIQLAILRLYVWPADAAPAARLASGEALLAQASTADQRRDLHLLLAEAILHYGAGDAAALAHLKAAEQAGGLTGTTKADTLVQIAELATEAGDVATARAHYTVFVREFPRDRRHYMVEQKLAALPPAPAADAHAVP